MPSSYVDSYTGAGRQHNTAPPHRSVQHSTVLHSTAQHSTAQHSTTQHNTTQHSTLLGLPFVVVRRLAASPTGAFAGSAVAVVQTAGYGYGCGCGCGRGRGCGCGCLWGSSPGAKHLPSEQPGLWEGGAGCEKALEAGRAQRQAAVAASVAEGRALAQARAGAGAGAAANRCTLQSGERRGTAVVGAGVVESSMSPPMCCSAVAVPAVVVNLL